MNVRRSIPVTIVTPRWKISQLCDIVRGEVKRHWLTPEQGRQIIRDGKAQMVYTPPQGHRTQSAQPAGRQRRAAQDRTARARSRRSR